MRAEDFRAPHDDATEAAQRKLWGEWFAAQGIELHRDQPKRRRIASERQRDDLAMALRIIRTWAQCDDPIGQERRRAMLDIVEKCDAALKIMVDTRGKVME